MIEQYGGRFLARAGTTELIDGGLEPKRIVILELYGIGGFLIMATKLASLKV
jgi:uncharacterized protein (DUF1330 family)